MKNLNVKLIFMLSLFGLTMAILTAFWVTQQQEMFIWPFLLLLSAYIMGTQAKGSYFLNGFLVSICNCAYILIIHLLFWKQFTELNKDMMKHMHGFISDHPRMGMTMVGAGIGVASGTFLGLLSLAASKIFKKKAA